MRKLKSFDIFDTLIARRCVEPHNVFMEVEQISGHKNFCNIRIKAEKNVSQKSYTLDDIYEEMVSSFGYSVELADTLKRIEIEQEIKNAIPIKENLEKVNHGDLLITDMYLPRSVIETLLEKVGFKKQVGLIISSHGKSSGEVWPKLNNLISIDQHIGDNLRSDVTNPLNNGIYGVHLANHIKTQTELFFEKNGLSQLSMAVR